MSHPLVIIRGMGRDDPRIKRRKMLLESIIKKAPASETIFRERVSSDDIRGHAQEELKRLERALFGKGAAKNPMVHEAVMKAREKTGGVEISGDRLYLLPVAPEGLWGRSEGFYLISRTFGKDIFFRALSEHGVWGRPGEDMPTYLQHREGFVYAYSGEKEDQMLLFVDSGRLLEKRSVFLDPESIIGEIDTILKRRMEVLGQSFLVCGGIPHEAIFQYQFLS